MRRLHWSTLLGAAVFGTAALALIGPVAVAVVLLRCCDASSRPGWGAWAIVLGLVALVTTVAAVAGALVGHLLHWLVARRGR